MPAIDRLKNYDKHDLDLEKFDAMFSHTYTPDSMDATNEFSMFAGQMSILNQITSESCKEIFYNSLNDAEIPDEVMRRLQTRDVLKQLIEESCSAADYRGMKVKGTRALENQLVTFRRWCNENPPDAEIGEDSGKHADVILSVSTGKRKTRTVSMTQTKYTSTVDRIHNTFKMG